MHVSRLNSPRRKARTCRQEFNIYYWTLCLFGGGLREFKRITIRLGHPAHHSTTAPQQHTNFTWYIQYLAVQYLIYLSSMHSLLDCMTQLTRNKHDEGSSRILISVSASSEAEVQSYYAAAHQLHFYIHNYDWSVSPRLHTLYKGV